MQTLNLVDNQAFEFNAFKVFDTPNHENTNRKLALMEQLQTSLELDRLLNIFAMEAAKYVDFSGLCFKKGDITAAIRGSRTGRNERSFELKLNQKFVGILTYAINSPISITNYKILNELHQYLIHPLNNALNYQEAMQLAMQDGLTSLNNRRSFDEQLKRAMHHANRQRSKVGLIVCDLDKFKVINDTYGHNIGDEVLIHFAQALKESVRDSDSLFRFGGDEFSIIVENATIDSLIVIEQRIYIAMASDALLSNYKMSCSLGHTMMNGMDTQASFFERADKALYQNKMFKGRTLSLV
jgi:two-component system, cell cycle response regulator